MSRRRAAVLIGVHVIIAIHIVQWKLTGSTLSPVEPSEAMQTLERGRLNAGFLFFAAAILATLVFGRFFCGWACHVVALQDLCGHWMRRAGIKPRPFRSRLLAWIPAGLALYMFVWPTFKRELLVPLLQRVAPDAAGWVGVPPPFPGFSTHLVEQSFWQTFPSVAVAVPFLAICGFAVVYFMGSKGFCTYGCPYGGVFAPADRLAPGKIVADLDACESCGHCTATCTSNVRVHEEIQIHGMVVDSGCMKCMDCVSVCPNEALSFGFRKPSAFSRPENPAKKQRPRRFDLGLGEEILLALVFLGTFFSVRGAYDLIPMLMAVGVGLTVTYLVWLALRLVRRPSVSLHRSQLKHGGRWRRGGALAFAGTLLATLLVAHTGVVSYNAWRGDRLDRHVRVARGEVLAGTATIGDDVREAARRAREHYVRARGIGAGGLGLVDSPELAVRAAWLDLVLGERERARSELRALYAREGGQSLALEVATVERAVRGPEAEASFLAQVMIRHPEYREVLDLRARRFAEAGRVDDATELYTDHLARRPDDSDARASYGAFLLSLGRVEEAVPVLARASRDAPDVASIRHDHAVALFMAGRPGEAIREMERAVALDPHDPLLVTRLAEMRRQAGAR